MVMKATAWGHSGRIVPRPVHHELSKGTYPPGEKRTYLRSAGGKNPVYIQRSAKPLILSFPTQR